MCRQAGGGGRKTPPTPTLPHKGGGSILTPSPLVGEGGGGGVSLAWPALTGCTSMTAASKREIAAVRAAPALYCSTRASMPPCWRRRAVGFSVKDWVLIAV